MHVRPFSSPWSRTGTGNVVAMKTSPAFVTPDIGAATGTSAVLTGAITTGTGTATAPSHTFSGYTSRGLAALAATGGTVVPTFVGDGAGDFQFAARGNSTVLGATAGIRLGISVNVWEIGFRTHYNNGWFEITDSSNNIYHRWHAKDYLLASDGVFGWASESNYATGGVGARDLAVYRGAAGVLEQRNSTNAQKFRVYHTYTDTSNYQRSAIQTGSDYVELAAETAGTGADNVDVKLTPAGTGAARIAAPTYTQVPVTAIATGANRNVTTAESRTAFTNEGATARQDFTLPAAAANLSYAFIVQDTDGVRVIAGAGDTIRIAASVSAAAGRIDSITIGDSVTLLAINSTEWIATSLVGAGWTAT